MCSSFSITICAGIGAVPSDLIGLERGFGVFGLTLRVPLALNATNSVVIDKVIYMTQKPASALIYDKSCLIFSLVGEGVGGLGSSS